MRKFLLASTFLTTLVFAQPAAADPVSLIIAGASYFGASATTVAFLGSFVGRVIITAGLTLAANALMPKPKTPSMSSMEGIQGREENFPDNLAVRNIVYGRVQTTGPVIYAETTNDNQYLHMVVPVAGHEIESFDEFYFDDELLTIDGSGNVTAPNKFANKARILTHLGTTNQAADATLIAESNGLWTTNHTLSGIAYFYVRLNFDQDAFPNGRPVIKTVIKGKKVYDPRTTTTAFSSNTALCVLDYLQNSTYGLGASAAEVNMTSFSAAANICDEDVALAAGGNENRYETHGVVLTDASPKNILENLLTSCAGTVYYSSGVWNIKAAAYYSPTVTITDDDMRGPINVTTKHSRRDNFNLVKGVFVSPDQNWQATDFPAIKSSVFETDDNNIQSALDLTLPFTISSPMAQRIAKIALYRQRQQIGLTLKCKLTAFQIEVGDVIMLTNTRYGFSAKPFEVMNYQFAVEGETDAPIYGVDLMLQETSSSVYDWSAEELTIELDNTSLPNYSVIDPPVMTISDELRSINQEVVTVMLVNLASSNQFITEYEVDFKKTTDTVYTSAGKSSGTKFEILKVEDGVSYNVRSKAISSLGVVSALSTAIYQVVGKTAPPSDVTDLSINSIGGSSILTWTPVTDLDLSHYKVRYSQATTGATYQNAVDLVGKVSRPANSVIVPSKTGTYFVKAVDKLNFVSANPAEIVLQTNIADVEDLNAIVTLTENPAFTGTKTNVVKITESGISFIQLDTSINFDSTSGNFDDAFGLFDGGQNTITTSGFYDFTNYVDLGEKYTSRVTANFNNIRIDYVDLFDSALGDFDQREGLFDGTATAFDDTSVNLQVATTDDDPAASPVWSDFRAFVVGDYSARALKFRAHLTSLYGGSTPSITDLAVTIDMVDRVISESDLVSGAGSYVVTFAQAFKGLSGIGIAAQNLVSGDYYAITAKSETGFTIVFRNSANVAISRTFDYVAKGYGKVI